MFCFCLFAEKIEEKINKHLRCFWNLHASLKLFSVCVNFPLFSQWTNRGVRSDSIMEFKFCSVLQLVLWEKKEKQPGSFRFWQALWIWSFSQSTQAFLTKQTKTYKICDVVWFYSLSAEKTKREQDFTLSLSKLNKFCLVVVVTIFSFIL